MVKKEIVWSIRANKELKKILEFYNKRNKSTKYSLKLLSEIDKLLDTLSQSEFIGRLTVNKKTRVLVVKVPVMPVVLFPRLLMVSDVPEMYLHACSNFFLYIIIGFERLITNIFCKCLIIRHKIF